MIIRRRVCDCTFMTVFKLRRIVFVVLADEFL